MKIKLWFAVLSSIILLAPAVQAEDEPIRTTEESEVAVSANSDATAALEDINANSNTKKARLIPLARYSDGAQMPEIETEVETLSAVDQMSMYVKELNLTSEQIDLAKYISDDSRLKQEQLLKSVYLLKEQAKSLEEKSLQDFRAILTPEQRKKFDNLRTWYERQYNLQSY
jgi:predicted nuclease with TOPRIM domain